MEEQIVKLHEKGLNDYEISKILNVSNKKIWYIRTKLGLVSNFSYSSRIKIGKDALINLVENGLKDSEIAKRLGVETISVYYARKRYNIERKSFSGDFEINPSNRQYSLIVGTLLGDGNLNISKGGKNARFSCEHGIKQSDYCKWKYEELKSIGATFNTYKRNAVDKRTGIFYESAITRIGATIQMTEMYNNMYINGTKQITDYTLQYFDELSLAVLFMDDGSKTKTSITIALCAFTDKDIDLFNSFCRNKWKFEFTRYKDGSIYLPTKYINKFKKLVLPYMHKTLLYKLP